MKLALILNVIDPKIGGVMIMGDRGTGKSTTIRALADLLPEIKVCCCSLCTHGGKRQAQQVTCSWHGCFQSEQRLSCQHG
jgi:Mg-chelatase subunit ChlI